MSKIIAILSFFFFQKIGFGSPFVEITEKSTNFYTQNFGSMEIIFPEAIKGHLDFYTGKSNYLSILSEIMEFKYVKKEGVDSKIITGWGDLGMSRSLCQEAEELKRIQKYVSTAPSVSLDVENIENSSFQGKVLVTKTLSQYWASRISYQVINRTSHECYEFILSVNEFEPNNRTDIESAVSPIIGPIEKAIKKYTNNEDNK